MNKDSKTKSKSHGIKPYRFGMGIELVDNNIISGPDIERVVNREMIGDESTNKVDESKNENSR